MIIFQVGQKYIIMNKKIRKIIKIIYKIKTIELKVGEK